MASVDVFFSLASAVSRLLQPLQASLEDEPAFSAFLKEFGWVVDPTAFSIGNVRAALPAVTALVTADTILAEIESADSFSPPQRYVELLDAFLNVVEGLENLPGSTAPAGIPADAWATFSSELFHHLVDAYLRDRQPGSLAALLAAGIVTEDEVDPGVLGTVPYVRAGVTWDRLGLLFTNPTRLFTEVYDWNNSSGTFRFDVLMTRLGRLLPLLGLPAQTAVPSDALLNDFYAASNPVRADVRELKVTLISAANAAGSLDVSLFILPIPDTGDVNGPPRGLAIGPSVLTTGQPPATAYWPFSLDLQGSGGRARYEGARVELVPSGFRFRSPASSDATVDARIRLVTNRPSPKLLIGSPFSHRLQFQDIALEFGAREAIDDPEVILGFEILGGQLVVDLSDADGFIGSALGTDVKVFEFDVRLVWSSKTGFHLRGSGALDIVIPLQLSFAGFTVSSLRLRVASTDGQVSLTAGVAASFVLGPIAASVEDIGTKMALAPIPAGQPSGLFGRLGVEFGFKPPNGIGLAIDAGSVKGGGFLFIGDAGRYSGALELAVFSVAVKAFGLIETKLPDGTPGFSFVIIIIAEFTPIQLGFGFTLLGVGGLVGVNRSINEQALGDGVRTGSLEHLLFPQNVVQDAPAIIDDLATVFPAAKGHFIVGPMAKLGWGTPTLITAELGIVLELPGPRLALLGLVRMVLPSADAAILRLQMAIAGLLDFPAKKVSVDASLFDSTVAGFVVTADMAYRMQLGSNASFLLSVGGFNPGFQPPPPFPTLRRASVNFGINGNPSLVASGYFALTSNTAQIGASIQLHASGFGIHLDGWLGFDVLFVFSPFSFTASISAGVRVSFHGVGFGVTLHGSLSGPSPWHLNGKVCVSVLWWDACLPVDVTFGDNKPASLPEIDPWIGDSNVPVIGLAEAISDPRNWAGGALPSEFTVVTLADAATAERTPIDPLGAATLRQKVAPFNRKLDKFGQYKPKEHDQFSLGAGLGTVLMNSQAVTEVEVVKDEFAPDHFMNLTNEQKLSLPSYEPMDAGISVAPNRTSLGSSESRVLDYVTKYIDAEGTVHDNQPLHRLTQAQLNGLLTRSAAALGGIRQAGAEKYILAGRPKNVQLGPRAFVVADACTLVKNASITGTEISQSQAILALNNHLSLNPQDRGRFAVIPAYTERAA